MAIRSNKEKENLNLLLASHLTAIHETIQVLGQTPPSSSAKLAWDDVIKMGDQVSKQATTVGMLWTGEKPESKAVKERSHSKDQKLSVPQLVGAVSDACSALKKTPSTNITAIGRGMTQVAVSVKDVLREMKELRPVSSDGQVDKAAGEICAETASEPHDDSSSEGDLGNDLSPEEMKVVERAIEVVSNILSAIKVLIHSIIGLLKLDKPNDNSSFVNSLEKLLQLCQELSPQIDEIGACLYPPQEIPAIKAALEKIHIIIDASQVEVRELLGASDVFLEPCNDLRSSLRSCEEKFTWS